MAATLQWIVIPKPAPETNITPTTLTIAAATTLVAVIDLGGGMIGIYFV